jgi:hypothetical protein
MEIGNRASEVSRRLARTQRRDGLVWMRTRATTRSSLVAGRDRTILLVLR